MIYLELLAPAKDLEIGIAAIHCGADAVYIAGPNFGARKDAANTVEDIKKLCEYGHLFGVRIFVAFNTIIYDHEIEEAQELLMQLEKAGVDGLIVQDLALLRLKENFHTNLPLHASTQCAIRDVAKAKFYESLGFSRLVLERACSLEQIREIASNVNTEIECFVHGALCVSYSGQCYMSEYLCRRSANRGTCIQACRNLYDLVDDNGNVVVKNKALLSLKDLSLKDKLEELAEVGVNSFKIEGRLKNISYVKNTVREYSLALNALISKYPDKYARASFGSVYGECFTSDINKTFNRGYTSFYINKQKGKWACLDAAKSMGEYVGNIEKIIRHANGYTLASSWRQGDDKSDNCCFELHIKTPDESICFQNGDGFACTLNGEVIGFRADKAKNNTVFCKALPRIKEGLDIYRNYNIAFERELKCKPCNRKLKVEVYITITYKPLSDADGYRLIENHADTIRRIKNYRIAIKAISEDGREVNKCFDLTSENAQKRERMLSLLEQQISKQYKHYFLELKSISSEDIANEIPMMSLAFMNEMRREVCDAINSIPCTIIEQHRGRKDDTVEATSDITITGFNLKDKSNHRINTPHQSIDSDAIVLNYKSNVSNKLSKELLSSRKANVVQEAFELKPSKNIELMRMKYCIKYEIGLCPIFQKSKNHGSEHNQYNGALYLRNKTRLFLLKFDCKLCEMSVLALD